MIYKDYQNKKIIIYFTPQTEPHLRWAKTFWLLKTAHPIIFVPLQSEFNSTYEMEPLEWIQKMLPECQNIEGLIVPVYVRPLVEIDLLQDSHRCNRVAYLKNKSPIICRLNQNEPFEKTEINDVFEDFSDDPLFTRIKEETQIIKEKLHMQL